MPRVTSEEKLWHTPLTLNVKIKGHNVVVPLDKRFLTICKHQIEEGHTAELFKAHDLCVLYTRLHQPDHALIAVRHGENDIGALVVQGRAFEESFSTHSDTHVQGLTRLAEAIVSRHARVPQVDLHGVWTQTLPAYTSLKTCKLIIKALKLAVPVPDSPNQRRVFQGLQREKMISVSTTARPLPRRRFTGLAGAHLMLKFNNNFISRMVSASPHSNLFNARACCLNVAAAQTFKSIQPKTTAFLGSTLEAVDIKTAACQRLERLKNTAQPCTRVSLIDASQTKHKIPVYALTAVELEALNAVNIKTRYDHLPTYVAFTSTHHPILLGDLAQFHTDTPKPEVSASYLQKGGELLTRRWLSAACNYHPELMSALSILSRGAAPTQGSMYGYNPVPALDMWAQQQVRLEQ